MTGQGCLISNQTSSDFKNTLMTHIDCNRNQISAFRARKQKAQTAEYVITMALRTFTGLVIWLTLIRL